MRCVLVKLQCWECVITLLDDICEMAVQTSVHTVYGYSAYGCVCQGDNIAIGSLENICSSYALYLTFIDLHEMLNILGSLI